MGLFLLLLSLEASAYTVTSVAEAPQWQVDWSYNQERPDWQEPQASDFVNFAVMLVTIEETLQPYVSDADLLALFIGDELRGLATPALDMTAGTTDPTRFLLKAYGNESDGERIDATLKYYNAQLRQVFTRSATMVYDIDVVLGIDEVFSPAFTLGSAKYPVTTTLDVAALLAAEAITPADGDIAAAFVGDECRGVCPFTSTDPQSEGFMLQCALANEGEAVVMKYYDADRSRILTFDGSVTGDANGDGTVDVADIATVITVMAAPSNLPPLGEAMADVNGDGTVDVADIATIISIMAAPRRPLTISVTEHPYANPNGSRATRSKTLAAPIVTASTFDAFDLDYTYGASHGSATATKDGKGKWGSTDSWPLTAARVSWYAHNGGTFYTNENDGTPYLSFSVEEAVAYQKDLLVSTATGTYGDNLSFTFSHVCSALRFYMKKAKNMSDYTLTVTSVILKNVVKTGNYYYGTSTWEPGTASTDYTYYTLFTGSATLDTADYTPMDTSEKPYVIVIPQTLTAWAPATDPTTDLSNSYLELECTISKGDANEYSGKAYIPFAATFTQGCQHDVKVNIGKNSLYSAANTKVIK